jgi:hypothetical protein
MKSTKDGASNEHWITDLKNKVYMKQTNLRIIFCPIPPLLVGILQCGHVLKRQTVATLS